VDFTRPGQMGFHTRTQFNLKLLKIANLRNKTFCRMGRLWSNKEQFSNYCRFSSSPIKRLITFRDAERPFKDIKQDINGIESIIMK
jgi:ribosomal protein L3